MKEMDKISKLLEETQNLLEGFSSGSLSPVSSYYNSDSEGNEEELTVMTKFKELLRSGDNSKICKFIEEQQETLPKGALHIAVEEKCKDLEIFKSLLRVGCDPLELDSNQKTALTILLEQKDEEASDSVSMFQDDEDCTISTLLGEWELRRAATRDSKIFRLIHARNWKELYSFLLTAGDPVKLLCKPDAKYAGISPLHEIAALNDVTTLRKLLKKFKWIDFNVKAIGSGNTPLHEATHMTSAEMVVFLLENGAKCDIKNAAGKIPAHLGTEKIQVIIEIKNMTASQEEIKQQSPQPQLQPSSTTLSSKKSADLFVKATKSASSDSLTREERKLKQIIGFLDQIEKHESKDVKDNEEESGNESEIENGSNRSEVMKERTSTSKVSHSHSNTKIDSTDSHNSTVNITNKPAESDTNSLMIDNILQRENHSGRTILHRFARRNQSEKLLKFLKENDFDESKCKSLKIFEVIDNSGCTPLHDAASEGSLEAAKIFLFGGKAAKPKNLLIDPSIPAAVTGDTPLHAAAASGNAEIVELLLAVGANKQAENIEGKRAIDVTRSKTVKKLLIGVEDVTVKDANVTVKDGIVTAATKINNKNNNNLGEVPVKRGPGRPRKYPRPDEIVPVAVKVAKLERSESVLIPSSPPRNHPQPLQPQLTNFSFSEIQKDGCLILVKIESEWLMLLEQFQKIISHLSKSDIPIHQLHLPTITIDNSTITSLPRIGNLLSSLQSRDKLEFVSKIGALQVIEKEFRVHLNGPFGYIDIPRLQKLKMSDKKSDDNSMSDNIIINNNTCSNTISNLLSTTSFTQSGCPLKLKLKLEKRDTINQSSVTWLSNTQFCEEQKSPKTFLM